MGKDVMASLVSKDWDSKPYHIGIGYLLLQAVRYVDETL